LTFGNCQKSYHRVHTKGFFTETELWEIAESQLTKVTTAKCMFPVSGVIRILRRMGKLLLCRGKAMDKTGAGFVDGVKQFFLGAMVRIFPIVG
jgi:hypothetical protein